MQSSKKNYTKEDIMNLVEEEDVEFIRLQFTDMFGCLKNMAITSSQLLKALDNKCMFDGSAIEGFVKIEESDLFLYPDLSTLEIFPWRPQQGKVARLICDVYRPGGEPFEGDSRYILRRALKEAEKILGDTDEACTFFLGSKHILFTIGEATLVCRLLEGEFLDWRRVLPQNQPVKLAVNVAKMTDSIERVGLIISEKLKSPVRCKFGENTADFRSVSTIGEAHDVCQIAGDGQDMEIGFNCRYLLDALRAIPDAECSLELINGLSPIVMNPCDGSERYSYMVLPVRLKAGE